MTLRPPRASRWADHEELGGLLLFAQGLEEKLFDYTIDSYKARALNLHTVVFELDSLAAEFEQGRILPGVLIPVLEEAREKLDGDPVLDAEEKAAFATYLDRLDAARKLPSELSALTDAVLGELSGRYWRRLLAVIPTEVAKPRNARRILALADTFVSEAELQGFHRSYVYYWTKRFFWRRRISSAQDVKDFLNLFEGDRRNYTFVFRASKPLLDMRDYSPVARVEISADPPEIASAHRQVADFLAPSDDYPLYVLTEKVEARDPVSARLMAEQRLATVANVYAYHVHQEEPTWKKVALCLTGEGRFEGVLKPPLSPMRRCLHSTVAAETERIKAAFDVLRGVHFSGAGAGVFHQALEYHRAAAETNTPENQLVDLWAALEGFLPPPDPETNRISHFVSTLLPTLSLRYAEKLFRYTAEGLERANATVRDIVTTMPVDGDFVTKTTAMLVSDDLQDVRERVYAALGSHPLLRFRCFTLHESFRKAAAIHETLEAHRRRVSWHLQRIYATRNQIVHSAQALPYIDALVENLHGYVDALLSAVVVVAAKSHARISIDGALKMLSVHEQNLLHDLSESDERATSENFLRLVYGRANPLSPWNDGLTM